MKKIFSVKISCNQFQFCFSWSCSKFRAIMGPSSYMDQYDPQH